MPRVTTAVLLSGVLLAAAWVQAPAAPGRESPAPSAIEIAAVEQTAQSVGPAVREIDEEAERLRQHLAARLPFNRPVRDPFRFKGVRPIAPETSRRSSRVQNIEPVDLKPPAPPPIAVPTLIGVTEDVVNGVLTRTAVLSMDDDMAMVKIGQSFSRFIVKSIGPTSVELIDITTPSKIVSTVTIR
jgi:hypothetical protein